MQDENIILDDDIATTTGKPKIYSKRAIWGFSFFFTRLVGGILLMQNLKDIGRKKEAFHVLIFSILFTAISIYIVNIPEKPQSSLTNLCNLVGGAILSEFYFRKYFTNEKEFLKKKIWKPLIISIIVSIPFLLALIYTMNE